MKWYKTSGGLSNWLGEFGPAYDVPDEVLDLVQKGLADDYSTRHESSPSFGKDRTDDEGHIWQVKIWVAHPDPAMREDPDEKRFVVLNEENDVLANTDDVNEAVAKYLKAVKGFSGNKGSAMTLESIQERMWDLTRKPGRMTPEDDAEMMELRKKHRELHPEGKELPKFLSGSMNSGRKNKASVMRVANWLKEFGPEYDVPKEIIDLVNQRLADDYSWHNDVAPSFGKTYSGDELLSNDRDILIWVNHPDPDMREDRGSKRFSVWDSLSNDNLLDTDDVNEAIRAYLGATGQKAPKDRPMTLESIQERMWDLTRRPRKTPEEQAEMKDLMRRHKELHPEGKELPKFLARRDNPRRTIS